MKRERSRICLIIFNLVLLDNILHNHNILIHGIKGCGKYNFLMYYFSEILKWDLNLKVIVTKIDDTEIEYESNKYFNQNCFIFSHII